MLYSNKAISILLQKLTKERDEALKENRAAKRVAKRRRIDEDGGHSQQGMVSVEEQDRFAFRDIAIVDEDCVNEEVSSMQDLSTVRIMQVLQMLCLK